MGHLQKFLPDSVALANKPEGIRGCQCGQGPSPLLWPLPLSSGHVGAGLDVGDTALGVLGCPLPQP